jgi:hypothetical protein
VWRRRACSPVCVAGERCTLGLVSVSGSADRSGGLLNFGKGAFCSGATDTNKASTKSADRARRWMCRTARCGHALRTDVCLTSRGLAAGP